MTIYHATNRTELDPMTSNLVAFSRKHKRQLRQLSKNFVPGGTRTHNLLIRSQMLYPVELQTPNQIVTARHYHCKNAQ